MGNHFHHHQFNGFERKLIKDKSDLPVIALIDDLSLESLYKINDSILYKPTCLKHSCEIQTDWLKNFMFFWGKNNNKDPHGNLDCLEAFRKSTHPLRYRIWFAVHYPNEVEIIEDRGDPQLARDFLKQAREEFELVYRRFHKSN